MISFDENSFIYQDIILVRDPTNYVNITDFTDEKKTKPTSTSLTIDSPIKLSHINSTHNQHISGGSNNTSFTENENYVPTHDELSLIDTEREVSPEQTAVKQEVTISNHELMFNAVPIWHLKSSDYANVLNDFEHYKDASFAIAFSKTISDDISPLGVDDLLQAKSVNADALHKFKVTYIEIPTENPFVTEPVLKTKDYVILHGEAKIKKGSKADKSNVTDNDTIKGNINDTTADTDVADNDNINDTTDVDNSPMTGGLKSSIPTRKIPLLTFTNMSLFKTATLYELKQYIAFQLRINVTNVQIRIRDTNSVIYPYTKIVTEGKYKWEHIVQIQASERNARYAKRQSSLEVSEQSSNTSSITSAPTVSESSIYTVTELTDRTVSVGSNSIIITIKPNTDSRTNIYEELFYPNYLTSAVCYKNLLSNSIKHKLPSLKFDLNISQVSILLVYKGLTNSHSNVNIVKLFNINHVTEKCSKIYIQSKILDDFKHNPRQMQYVKVFKHTTNHFKGIDSLYNTCSFYMNDPINEYLTGKPTGIIMNHMDVSENMNITFTFTNTNSTNTYTYIFDMIMQYISLRADLLLRKIRITETIYNTEYKFDYYVPIISNISAGFTISNACLDDLSNITEIVNQEIPQMKFSTRTSMFFTIYSFYNLAYWYNMLYLSQAHEYLTTGIIYKDIFPTIHCIFNSETNELSVTLNRMNSFDNLLYAASLIIGTCKHPKSTADENISLSSDGKVNVDAIRKAASKYDKKLLKLLTKIDPTLFGPRYIGTKNRSYSGLCQKKEQRPVPISEHEYDELMKNPDLSMSLTKVRNQTYPDQFICLFCADKTYKFLNYHHFPNQKCIVRCTSKSSNKTQYEYCRKDLDAQNWTVITNRYENQTITLYNCLITKGRKCRVPEELRDVLSNYVLTKLSLPRTNKIDTYCMNTWNKHAFIIQRSLSKNGDVWVCNKYYIKTDYSSEFDYVLILESEGDESYFVFLTEGINPKPLVFSQNDDIREFFVTHVKQTNDNNDFLRYLEKVMNVNLGDLSIYPMKEILRRLKVEYELKYIIDNEFIVGVLRNNIVYMTPALYWYFEDGVGIITLFQLGRGLMEKTYDGPDISTLNHKLINSIYVDYGSQQIKMIKYCGHHIFVKPFEITAKYANADIIQFDYYARLNMMINAGKDDVTVASNDADVKNFEVSNVINTYVYIFLMNNENISKREFFKFMATLGTITNGPTYTNYCDKLSKRFISWRSSKINKDEFLHYINKFLTFNTNELISINYTILNNEMEFSVMNNEEIQYKIITS